MSRGFNSLFYPYLYEWLPFIRGLRVPARASILVGLTLALLAAFGVRRLARGTVGVAAARRAGRARRRDRDRSRARCCGSNRSGSSRRPSTDSSPGSTDVVLAEFPFGGNPTRFTPNVPFMYFSLWHWAPMINGYSGHYPPGQVDFEVAVQGFPDAAAIDLLRARGVTHVTINCALYRGGCEELVAAVDALAGVPRRRVGQMAGCARAALRAQGR